MSIKNIDFGNEAADDINAEDLVPYFMKQDAFDEHLASSNKLLVVTARRGVGKSALLQWIGYKINEKEPGDLVIVARGADLVRDRYNLHSKLNEPNDYIHDWMIRICSLINRYLASEIGFALTDDKITLVETAEISGFKQKNIVGCLVDRLQGMIGNGRHIDKQKTADEIEILKRNKSGKKRNVWLIVDDLDATFQRSDEESLSLSTFFSACRYLVRDVLGLRIRASIRTDVWPFIRRFDEATGKLDQYRREISWGIDDFRKLLALRIRAGELDEDTRSKLLDNLSPHDQDMILNKAFEAKMKWGEKYVNSYKLIYTLSYERPRWAIQLCKLAQAEALHNNNNVITKTDIDEIWGDFGSKRKDDLVAEHRHQCPEIEEVLNGFRGADRLMTMEQMILWIKNHIFTHLEVIIDGKRARSPLEIAHFLYRVGFIVARSDEKDGNYEHYRFDQMPDFLSPRTNNDFGIKWEIHPCYREAFDIKKLNRAHRAQFGRQRGLRNKKRSF